MSKKAHLQTLKNTSKPAVSLLQPRLLQRNDESREVPGSTEKEASVLTGYSIGNLPIAPPARCRIHSNPPVVQRQQKTNLKGTASDVEEFEAERKHFEESQESYFGEIGEIIKQHLLKSAGFSPGQPLSTPEDALKVVQIWGITIETLTRQLPQVIQSLSGQVQGKQTDEKVEQQQQDLIAALTPAGQKAYQGMIQTVRSEPFWRQHLDTNQIYIFPDLTGRNRYGGYLQKGTYQTDEGLTRTTYVIHISKDRLNNGEVQESAATLIHELSHTLGEPNVTERSLKPLTGKLAELLVDHPQIVAMRRSASNPEEARQLHLRRINQILFEYTGYAEGEIFVHLQQLTHQPPVRVQGETEQPHIYILNVVTGYIDRLKRIRMPPHLLAGILRSLRRRVEQLYKRRIAATPAGSTQRRLLELSLEQALGVLNLAVHE